MLKTRPGIFSGELGAPSRYVHDNFDIVGYDVGFNSSVRKVGFTKNTISTNVKGYVDYEFHLPNPLTWSKLKQEGVVTLNDSSSLISQVEHIPIGQPLEVVLYPDKGHIGFWPGSSNEGLFELGVAYTRDHEFITVNNLCSFLGWRNADQIPCTKTPISLDSVMEINLLG